MYARLALACGEPSIRRLLRSVDATDLAFWNAYEQVEGPIGVGPLVRLAAWLGWTQCDPKKVPGPEYLLDWLQAFAVRPPDVEEEEDEPLTEEEIEELRVERLGRKLMAMFGSPDLRERDGHWQSEGDTRTECLAVPKRHGERWQTRADVPA